MSFDKDHGFEKPGYSNSLNPEYVKLQRKEVVKAFQDQCEKLQAEIKTLKKRVSGLKQEIDEAFKDERKHLEAFEKALKDRERQIGDRSGDLRKRQSTFNKMLKEATAELDAKRAEIKTETERAEYRIRASQDQEQRLIKVQKAIKDGRAEALEVIKTLQEKEKELRKLESTLKTREMGVGEDESRNKTRSKTLSQEKKDLDAARSLIESSKAGIRDQELALARKEEKVQNLINEFNSRLEKLEAAEAKANGIIKNEKKVTAALEDRARQLNIAERNFRQDSAYKKRELDEREANVRALEKKVG